MSATELTARTTASLNLLKYCIRGHVIGLSSALQVKQWSDNRGLRRDLFVNMLLSAMDTAANTTQTQVKCFLKFILKIILGYKKQD
uniref:Uncharacterized protein n=1 Tax=Pararge aegeria TaxID=116150 RepID=S4NQ24_9NEOP